MVLTARPRASSYPLRRPWPPQAPPGRVPGPQTPSIPPALHPRGAARCPLPGARALCPAGPTLGRGGGVAFTCSAPPASAWSSGTGLARGRPPALSGGCSGCSGSWCSWPSPPPAGPGCCSGSGSGSGSESVCQVESQSSTVVGSRKLTPPSRLPIEEAAAGAGCGSALGPGHGRAPLGAPAASSHGPRRTAQRGRRRSSAQAGRSRAPRGRRHRRTRPSPPIPPPPRPRGANPTPERGPPAPPGRAPLPPSLHGPREWTGVSCCPAPSGSGAAPLGLLPAKREDGSRPGRRREGGVSISSRVLPTPPPPTGWSKRKTNEPPPCRRSSRRRQKLIW